MEKGMLMKRISDFFTISESDSICLMDCKKTFDASELEFKIVGIAKDYFTYLVNGEIEFGELEILSIIDLEKIDGILSDERHEQLEKYNDPNNLTWFRGNKKDYLPKGY